MSIDKVEEKSPPGLSSETEDEENGEDEISELKNNKSVSNSPKNLKTSENWEDTNLSSGEYESGEEE